MRKDTILALVALGLANVLLAQDLAALNVALPSIERDLDVDITTAQWVVNAYLLVYGMMIVTGGRLADELGRRRVFLFGVALFGVMSLVGARAPNASWLIAARALMGIGSGLMLPSILGMGYAVLPPQRAELAGGLIIGAYGIGMALGPMIGGALTEFLGWRWIQVVNVPLAVVVFFGVWRTIPVSAPTTGRPTIDYPGIVTLSAGLVALLFALDQATDWGWGDWRILLSLGLAAAFIVVFLLVERRAGSDALVPCDIMRHRGVAVACVLKALMGPAYSASLLFAPQVMQKILGFSPFTAGVGMLPMLGTYAVVSLLIGSFAGRLSLRVQIIAGMACLAIGPFLLSRFGAGYGILATGLFALGLGLGLFQSSSTTEAVQADEQGRKSLASGLVTMFQFVGGAVGLGLTTTIVASAERSAVNAQLTQTGVTLPPAQRAALDRLLAGSESVPQVLQQFGADEARRLLDAASDAFAAGFQSGMRLDAAIAGIGFAIAVLLIRKEPRGTAPEADTMARKSGTRDGASSIGGGGKSSPRMAAAPAHGGTIAPAA
jgi:EmrB/QacA subfamily drug resistance transporter